MKIKKIGHCCLLIEVSGCRILTDPGNFTDVSADIDSVDIVIISHEHVDHLHVPNVKDIISKNPNVQVITNSRVGTLLEQHNISYLCAEDGVVFRFLDVSIKAYNAPHVEIYKSFGMVENTAFLIAETLFYPGDSFTVPREKVQFLAVPIAGPWCKIADVIDYVKLAQPDMIFPVHDWVLSREGYNVTTSVLTKNITDCGIAFAHLRAGETIELE
jgi:L-ascorbate metabolism protein UlaG (beta-lactamase superfamily)